MTADRVTPAEIGFDVVFRGDSVNESRKEKTFKNLFLNSYNYILLDILAKLDDRLLICHNSKQFLHSPIEFFYAQWVEEYLGEYDRGMGLMLRNGLSSYSQLLEASMQLRHLFLSPHIFPAL